MRLSQESYQAGEYSLVPIRYGDRVDIMKWRNEQIYHLRQSKPLTEDDQENYFQNVVSKLFEVEQPDQLLFSYLENDKCIGYGGLVHINWLDRNAEISFIIATNLEKDYFHKHWGIYLGLIEKVAFEELRLHKIYTYAFDLRPHLYEAIEAVGYLREATLEEHCYFDGRYRNVVIHAKKNGYLAVRGALEPDVNITHEWANDEATRRNSFSSEPIQFETHSAWWKSRLRDKNAIYFIGEMRGNPVCLIRFDKDIENGTFVIGINIAPKFRGQGLSHRFLTMACYKFLETHDAPIDAYIKVENIPSIKSFEKAGFRFVKETEINGSNAVMYQMTRE